MSFIIHNAHNNLIAKTLSQPELARDFLATFLPKKILKVVDLNNLKVISSQHVGSALKASQSDIIYEVMFKNKTAYLFCLFEHQSTPDPSMPLRLLNYSTQFWLSRYQKGKKLPIVLPILFSQCAGPWEISTDFEDMIHWDSGLKKDLFYYLPKVTHLLVDLHTVDISKLKMNLANELVLSFMKKAKEGLFKEDLIDLMSKLSELYNQGSLELVEALLRYAFSMSQGLKLEEFCAIVENEMDESGGKKMMTLAEELFAQGEAKGEARGEAKGKAEGEIRVAQRTLYKLYVKKFGINPKIEKQIQFISNLEKLEDLIVDFSDFSKKEEFSKELAGLLKFSSETDK